MLHTIAHIYTFAQQSSSSVVTNGIVMPAHTTNDRCQYYVPECSVQKPRIVQFNAMLHEGSSNCRVHPVLCHKRLCVDTSFWKSSMSCHSRTFPSMFLLHVYLSLQNCQFRGLFERMGSARCVQMFTGYIGVQPMTISSPTRALICRRMPGGTLSLFKIQTVPGFVCPDGEFLIQRPNLKSFNALQGQCWEFGKCLLLIILSLVICKVKKHIILFSLNSLRTLFHCSPVSANRPLKSNLRFTQFRGMFH